MRSKHCHIQTHNMPVFISFGEVGGGGGGGLVDEKPIDASGKTATTTSYSGDIVNHYTYQGRKLGKKVYNSQHTLTVDEHYYDELMLSFGRPSRISHGDGYIALSDNGGATFYYYLKDHLGNVRSVILPDASNQPIVSQANDYFPFGISFESTLPNPGIRANYNKLKYNSKEEQEMPGKWLDYGARFYDAQLGRFHSVDPLADNFSYQSPYVYASNNPIRYIDVMGLFAGEYINKNGRIIGNDGIDDQNIHIVSNKEDTKTIKKNNNAGRVTNPAEVEIDVTTNKTELAEALDVLNRTIENGGFAEESSVVTPEGDITRGKRGEITEGGIALATLPYVEGEDNTSIHSHPTGTTQTSGWSALRPGPGDPPAFRGFKRNIIVGALGDPKTDHSGNDIPRPHGAAFFGRNITTASKPKAVLYKNAIERVLKK